mmetsp:Transcript_24828/g.38678  ORF Transcript_24828/g.38678 Transcript_24828/m.38678 type:complete len:83 (+) Transcript_24828:103-351(+)
MYLFLSKIYTHIRIINMISPPVAFLILETKGNNQPRREKTNLKQNWETNLADSWEQTETFQETAQPGNLLPVCIFCFSFVAR